MYGNIQGIKNLMSHYDSDGDYVNYKVSRDYYGRYCNEKNNNVFGSLCVIVY